MNIKNAKWYFILWCALGLLVGCQDNKSTKQPNRDQLHTQNISSVTEKDNHINQSVKQEFDQINDLTSLTYNDELLMAIQVNQLAQFSEQKIATEIESFITMIHPNLEATVSSDYKVFLEINRLKKKITTENLTSQDFNKQFQEIKKLTETPED